MSLDINAVLFLIDARRRGADFGEVLTLGRQDLNVYPAKMVKVLETHGFPTTGFKGDPKVLYAEPCFLSLGAKKVSSMDFSDFEGATYVHDLNKPIGVELKERFDLVYDGGTLEHVFNFPLGLQNCMEMVKPGGHLFIHAGTNGYCGHGFYQFSPELFYRALSPENGFEVLRMVLFRVGPYGPWYEVRDPNDVQTRVELVSLWPMQLLIRAKRTRVVPIFTNPPQQSDYTPRWQSSKAGDPPPISYEPWRPALAKSLPGVARVLNVCKSAVGLFRTHTLFFNRRDLRRVSKP
jgi:SAM-dependent methyltransferase